jgi:hypothetical protein
MPNEEIPDKLTSQSAEPVESAPLPDQPPAPVGDTSQLPKKKKTGLIVVLIVIGLLVLAGIGAGLYFVNDYIRSLEVVSQNTDTSLSPDSISDSVLKKLATEFKDQLVGTLSTPEHKGVPQYEIPENGYATGPSPNGESLSMIADVVTAETADINKETIENVLKNNGFTLEQTLLGGDDEEFFDARWISTDTYCGISSSGDESHYDDTLEKTLYDKYTVTIGCAKIADYVSHASTLERFFDAYKLSDEYDSKYPPFLGTPKNDVAGTKGYKTYIINMGRYNAQFGGYAGLYYETPDGTLRYFAGTQQVLPCDDYTTDDLKKAYLGAECYDKTSAEFSTVKL